MDLGFPELIVILVLALILFGPKKLPELGRGLGQGIREFRRSTSGVTDELKNALHGEPEPAAAVAASPVIIPAGQTVTARPSQATILADSLDAAGRGDTKA